MRLKIVLAAAVAVVGGTAQASSNLVVNGGFEQTTHGPDQIISNAGLVGWQGDGYNFVIAAGHADRGLDANGISDGYGTITFWGPGTGSNNGLTPSSPRGGNFIAMDGAYSGYGDSPTGRPVYQTIATTPGKDYRVNFFWAANQQNGFTNHPNFFTGATTEQVAVSLGEQTQYTDVVNNASHGFVPWRQQSFTFTATAANSVLSFLAIGTPQGFPPYVFLDGVSAAAVPEPAAWAMLVAGFGLIGVMARRRTGLVAA